ncbi:MAG: glycosyltransferase family 4 protein [Deltaproteobacteria bacterium]|nr:glycosyltransferase family 4 protein [Deltaproteobacteria bacterium]
MSRPLRIVRIIDRMNVGGPAIHVTLTSERLNDGRRFETLLVRGEIGPDEGDMSYLLKGRNIKEKYLPSLGRSISPWNDLLVFFQLVGLLRRERPDVVHTHKSKAGLLGRIAAFIARVPVRIHTFHGHVFHGYFSPLVSRLVVWTEKLLALITHRIFVVGDQLRIEMTEKYRLCDPAKILVVPLGLDLGPFVEASGEGREKARLALRQSLGVDSGKKLVGIVGRLTRIKNHAMFLEAARMIAGKRADTDFVIVGGGELETELQELARASGIPDQVHFMGFQTRTAPIYAGLDIIALTSDNEGTPVTLIEAGAAGLPAVSTDVGAVQTVVIGGETGFMVPKGDAAALAEKIMMLLDDTELRMRLGAAARRHVTSNFSIERLCDTLGRLYEELAARK